MKKKVLSLFLALVIVLGLLPMGALAADGEADIVPEFSLTAGGELLPAEKQETAYKDIATYKIRITADDASLYKPTGLKLVSWKTMSVTVTADGDYEMVSVANMLTNTTVAITDAASLSQLLDADSYDLTNNKYLGFMLKSGTTTVAYVVVEIVPIVSENQVALTVSDAEGGTAVAEDLGHELWQITATPNSGYKLVGLQVGETMVEAGSERLPHPRAGHTYSYTTDELTADTAITVVFAPLGDEDLPTQVTVDLYRYNGWYFLFLYDDPDCTQLLGSSQITKVSGAFYQPLSDSGSTVTSKALVDLVPGTYYIKGAKTAKAAETAAPVEYVVDASALPLPNYVANFSVFIRVDGARASAQEVFKEKYLDEWEPYYDAANINYDGELEIIAPEGCEISPITRTTDTEDLIVLQFAVTSHVMGNKIVELIWHPADARIAEIAIQETFSTSKSLSPTLHPMYQDVFSFTLPAEYESAFHIYQKFGLHYTPFDEFSAIDSRDNGDGTVTLSYILPRNTGLHYTIDNIGNNIKLSREFSTSVATDFFVRGYSNEVDDYMSNAGYNSDNWTHFELDNSLRLPQNPMIGANIYLGFSPDWTAQSSHMVTVNPGDSFRLEGFRVWQTVSDVVGNYFVEPDFRYEVIGDSVSLTPGGAEGREYETVTADGEGVSVIKVTYDATYFGRHQYYEGLRYPWDEGSGNTTYFNALDPENTGIVIVNVGGKNTANIRPNVTNPATGNALTEYDTFYFDRAAGSVDYTFTPTADAPMTVRVHDPLHNTVWGEGWTTYTADETGAYTVNLKEGRNILEISTADGSCVYWVIHARAVDITLKNLYADDGSFAVGDQVEVRISGMYLPVQKMAGIYNPNYPDRGWIEYTTADGEMHRSAGNQYTAVTASSSRITYTITEDCLNENGDFVLSGGVIHNEHLGSGLGAHHVVPLTGLAPNLNAVGGANSPYFCTLPVITIPVDADAVRTCHDGVHYGALEARGAVEPTCTEPGQTGDLYCTKCGELASASSEVPALGHRYTVALNFAISMSWNFCNRCGYIDESSYKELKPKPDYPCVRVIVENSTFATADGAPWKGRIVDDWFRYSDSSTMMSMIVFALGRENVVGAESNYISSINGLAEFDGGDGSGWMGTLNDWFTNEGFANYSIADGTLKDGDVIHVMYTCELGADLGGSWDNNDKSLTTLSVSGGELSPAFDSATHSYTLTLDEGVESIFVTPTAANKNFQVRTTVNGTEYARTAAIPVENGTVITVTCGDPEWPTMNEASDVPAEVYTITVEKEAEPKELAIISQPESVICAMGDTVTFTVEAEGDGLTYTWYYKNPGRTKFTAMAASEKNTYTITMNADRNGRQMYCVVRDERGNFLKSATATMALPTLTITLQPADVVCGLNSTANFAITAEGEGELTYQWYYKNPARTQFTAMAAGEKNSYAITMNADRNGRQMYCVVRDSYGNAVKSDVVTMTMPELVITQQPESVTCEMDEKVTFTVIAEGEGLTYTWYYKNPRSSKFTAMSASEKNTYTITMNSARDGRQMYCVVRDANGQKLTTDTVTMMTAR